MTPPYSAVELIEKEIKRIQKNSSRFRNIVDEHADFMVSTLDKDIVITINSNGYKWSTVCRPHDIIEHILIKLYEENDG